MALNILTTDEVLARGLEPVNYDVIRQESVKQKTRVRQFKTHFGSHPSIYAELWEALQTSDDQNVCVASNSSKDIDMFLKSIFYLKSYPLDDVLASRFGLHEQTCQKWVNFYVQKIAALKDAKIKWPVTWESIFIIWIDCVIFGINEPRHPTLHKDKELFDRKGGKAGLQYKVALHLWENRMVWFDQPSSPNKRTDAEVYRGRLIRMIPAGKKGNCR